MVIPMSKKKAIKLEIGTILILLGFAIFIAKMIKWI